MHNDDDDVDDGARRRMTTSSSSTNMLRPRTRQEQHQVLNGQPGNTSSMPPPVYHRHYKQTVMATAFKNNNNNNKPKLKTSSGQQQRLVLLLPILLFGSFLAGIGLLQQHQQQPTATMQKQQQSPRTSRSAMMQMLHASRQYHDKTGSLLKHEQQQQVLPRQQQQQQQQRQPVVTDDDEHEARKSQTVVERRQYERLSRRNNNNNNNNLELQDDKRSQRSLQGSSSSNQQAKDNLPELSSEHNLKQDPKQRAVVVLQEGLQRKRQRQKALDSFGEEKEASVGESVTQGPVTVVLKNAEEEHDSDDDAPVLTLFLQSAPAASVTAFGKKKKQQQSEQQRRPQEKQTTLTAQHFPIVPKKKGDVCQTMSGDDGRPSPIVSPSLFLPIDNFPSDDPYLPWIHDYWYNEHERRIQFVAQNRRRCETGKGKESVMKHWEPQVALFQSIPIQVVTTEQQPLDDDNQRQSTTTTTTLRLASKGALLNRSSNTNNNTVTTIAETRFVCHFHQAETSGKNSFVTFSQFPFNYEYVLWRKRGEAYKGMLVESGSDVNIFELSQLLFSCPVPEAVVPQDGGSGWYLDLVPLRTAVRRGPHNVLLTPTQVGRDEYQQIRKLARKQQQEQVSSPSFALDGGESINLQEAVKNSGRWANLPLCLPNGNKNKITGLHSKALTGYNNKAKKVEKPNYFVACTWTAESYFRRGDATAITDSARRLREWIAFHQLVGADHLYIYDNTQQQPATNSTTADFVSPLKDVVQSFSSDFVTYIPWPCRVCSNHRPNHANPGERSSQYAAEASCRERYGPLTEWMAFIDTDEYLVPMAFADDKKSQERVTSWRTVLEQKREQGYHVLKMRSSRTRPRVSLMETIEDETQQQQLCQPTGQSRLPKEECIWPRPSETLLRVYNCEYIRPPKPERFQRAMKQIYRPAFVKSHYVHYSTITQPMTEYYHERRRRGSTNNQREAEHYTRNIQNWEWGDVFLDELHEGCLVHAKSIVPHETLYRSSQCHNASKHVCPVGYECPDETLFVDKTHTKNLFYDGSTGKFCNCWINHHLEDTLIPRLEKALQSPHSSQLSAS